MFFNNTVLFFFFFFFLIPEDEVPRCGMHIAHAVLEVVNIFTYLF